MTRKRVYVAGAYSADNVIDVQANMRRGIAASVRLVHHGFAPFCPWLDFQFGLVAPITLAEYYEYTIAWVPVSEAILALREGLSASEGTQGELRVARYSSVPIFYDDGDWIETLKRYFAEENT